MTLNTKLVTSNEQTLDEKKYEIKISRRCLSETLSAADGRFTIHVAALDAKTSGAKKKLKVTATEVLLNTLYIVTRRTKLQHSKANNNNILS